MGYDLTLSRGDRWADNGTFSEIPIEEWNAAIQALPNLTPVEEVRGRNPLTGEEIVIKTPNGASLKLPEELAEGGDDTGPVLTYSKGTISAPYAEELLESYREIAELLDCQIYSEEGQTF